jgi:hypothetical protein
MSLAVLDRPPAQEARLGLIDCDVHPSFASGLEDMLPFLDRRWHGHLATYGVLMRQALG